MLENTLIQYVNEENSTGPITEPCGTPVLRLMVESTDSYVGVYSEDILSENQRSSYGENVTESHTVMKYQSRICSSLILGVMKQ